ncbi:Ring hydroxylating beta subunit [Lysobacter sp. yr284]|uniref:aromatic-ring-hydroxylating dioxygenase subunit beta n=1 Tax=Lysobacter TaxID=68 RepID=UPI00089924C6|nr:aromatic-ring-hydroxylating dioxygenase subunit beta [Lysobacter sp. yr284]SDY57254.1 Ring hydroxylating beta subunit [Lysobacter sp. yr284]
MSQADALKPLLTRLQVEDFLYKEARLLDEWRLAEWLELLTEDTRYEVPSTDVRAEDRDALAIVSDDAARLRQRADQLLGNVMWCENPRSRTRRLVANVCVLDERDGVLEVTANFAIHRFGNGRSDTFIGCYRHQLVRDGDGFRIRRRTVLLDHESLFEHGKISIIL